MRLVFGAHLRIHLFSLQIILAIGQSEAALADRYDVPVRILLIGADVQLHRRQQRKIRTPHESRQLGSRARGGNCIKRGLRRRKARAVDRIGIHVGAIEIAHFLLVAPGGRAGGKCFDQRKDFLQRVLDERIGCAPACSIRGNLVRIEPVSVCITEKVISGSHRRVVRRQVQPKRADLRLVGRVTFFRRCGMTGICPYGNCGEDPKTHKRACRSQA